MFGGYHYRTFCYATDAAKRTINLMNNEKANNNVVNIGNEFAGNEAGIKYVERRDWDVKSNF